MHCHSYLIGGNSDGVVLSCTRRWNANPNLSYLDCASAVKHLFKTAGEPYTPRVAWSKYRKVAWTRRWKCNQGCCHRLNTFHRLYRVNRDQLRLLFLFWLFLFDTSRSRWNHTWCLGSLRASTIVCCRWRYFGSRKRMWWCILLPSLILHLLHQRQVQWLESIEINGWMSFELDTLGFWRLEKRK